MNHYDHVSSFEKTNPNLYVFLPLFYMVWEDAGTYAK